MNPALLLMLVLTAGGALASILLTSPRPPRTRPSWEL